METKKTPFFIKLKNAIVNFDEYKTFSEEKTSSAIKYLLKLTLIFTLVITIALAWKAINELNLQINNFKNECPEFKFENNVLQVKEKNRFVKGDENGYFGFIVDSEKESLKEIEEVSDFQKVVAVLKDKIVIKDVDNLETSATYEQLSKNYNLENINRDSLLQFLSRKKHSKNIFDFYSNIIY